MSARRYQRCHSLFVSAAVLAVLCGRSAGQETSSQTRSLSVTLTAAGLLGTFNPPSDCTTFSAYSTQTLVFGDGNTRSFTLTSLRQGCQVGGPHVSCCPPNYELGQYNSPGVCPGGYTTHGDLEFVAAARRTVGFRITYAAIGTKTGKLCCPSVGEPITYTANGPVPICLATTKGPTITQGGSVVNQESDYFASAVIVVPPDSSDSSLPTVTQTESSSPGESSPADAPTIGSQTRPAAGTSASGRGGQPQESSSPGEDGGGGGGGGKNLSGGAIAGIAIGVAVPIIAASLYFTYRLGKRSKGQPVPPAPDGAKEPGIAEPSHIGGIQ
ncbi:hypothetical protein TWF696_009888 [Orbilia brochopaga]|uniref:Uncharacterized protein n=1 Tax=Orbilia brochopaga TaxID=3140254 RepID=A0AAV9UFH6_9PEZI